MLQYSKMISDLTIVERKNPEFTSLYLDKHFAFVVWFAVTSIFNNNFDNIRPNANWRSKYFLLFAAHKKQFQAFFFKLWRDVCI